MNNNNSRRSEKKKIVWTFSTNDKMCEQSNHWGFFCVSSACVFLVCPQPNRQLQCVAAKHDNCISIHNRNSSKLQFSLRFFYRLWHLPQSLSLPAGLWYFYSPKSCVTMHERCGFGIAGKSAHYAHVYSYHLCYDSPVKTVQMAIQSVIKATHTQRHKQTFIHTYSHILRDINYELLMHCCCCFWLLLLLCAPLFLSCAPFRCHFC